MTNLIWLLVKPSDWILYTAILGIAFWRYAIGRRLVVAAVVILLVLGVLPTTWLLTAPLEHRFPVPANLDRVDGIIVLAGASSIGEEIFFRGALLPVIGLVGSSAIFALLHIGPKARHLPWTASSFVVGLLFGAMFQWTGDLTGPVVAHFLVNFLNLRHVAQVELR